MTYAPASRFALGAFFSLALGALVLGGCAQSGSSTGTGGSSGTGGNGATGGTNTGGSVGTGGTNTGGSVGTGGSNSGTGGSVSSTGGSVGTGREWHRRYRLHRRRHRHRRHRHGRQRHRWHDGHRRHRWQRGKGRRGRWGRGHDRRWRRRRRAVLHRRLRVGHVGKAARRLPHPHLLQLRHHPSSERRNRGGRRQHAHPQRQQDGRSLPCGGKSGSPRTAAGERHQPPLRPGLGLLLRAARERALERQPRDVARHHRRSDAA